MNGRTSLVLALILIVAAPLSAGQKKKQERGMLEKMEAVPCGAKQKGLSGLGSFWASVGVTHVNSDEKLCPQYLLRTDDMDYEIRPTDLKHPVVLPVGHEAVFKIKKSHMLLSIPEDEAAVDHKAHDYQVVAMNPSKPDDDRDKSADSSTESKSSSEP